MATYGYGPQATAAQAQYTPVQQGAAQPGGPSIYDVAMGAFRNGASAAQSAASYGGPSNVSASTIGSRNISADNVSAEYLRNTSLNPYMNPYTQGVIDRSVADAQRQQAMSLNDVGAAATAARAFGGSRHGVAEGVAIGENSRNLADLVARLNAENFMQAQQAAQFDIGTQLTADRANQQANLSADQSNQNAALQAAISNQNAALQASLGNQRADLSAAQVRASGAGQLGSLGANAMNAGISAEKLAMQQAILRQQQQQQVMDAAKMQHAGYVGAPGQSLAMMNSAVGAAPAPTSTTQSYQPGVMDFLMLGL